jgi:hypothetical protein
VENVRCNCGVWCEHNPYCSECAQDGIYWYCYIEKYNEEARKENEENND